MIGEHIVYEADAIRYDILVTYLNNKHSDYYTQYCVSLVNFGECFFESDLSHIAQAILQTSGTFSLTDAKNIQNAIAEHIPNVRKVSWSTEHKQFLFI